MFLYCMCQSTFLKNLLMTFMTFLEDEEGAVYCYQPENPDLDLWTIKETGNFNLGWPCKQFTNASNRIKQSVTMSVFPLLLREYMILHRIAHACICGKILLTPKSHTKFETYKTTINLVKYSIIYHSHPNKSLMMISICIYLLIWRFHLQMWASNHCIHH